MHTDTILSIKLPLSLPAPSNLPMWNGIRTRMDIHSSKKYRVSLKKMIYVKQRILFVAALLSIVNGVWGKELAKAVLL